MEWLVEMTKRIVGDRGMCQIHHHRPKCAADDGALLWQLGYRCNSLRQLVCVHHAASRVIQLHQLLVTVVALMKPHQELLLAQVVVGHERRLCHHHLVVHILHCHTPARSISPSTLNSTIFFPFFIVYFYVLTLQRYI